MPRVFRRGRDVAERGVTREFSIGGFFWRLLASLILVIATYNPTGISYYQWLRNSMGAEGSGLGPEHFVVGMVLVIGWAVLFVAAQRSLGTVGLVLGAALIGGVAASALPSAAWAETDQPSRPRRPS